MVQLVDLKVGFSCNNNCIHCVISDKFSERDLTLQEIKIIIDKDAYRCVQSHKFLIFIFFLFNLLDLAIFL